MERVLSAGGTLELAHPELLKGWLFFHLRRRVLGARGGRLPPAPGIPVGYFTGALNMEFRNAVTSTDAADEHHRCYRKRRRTKRRRGPDSRLYQIPGTVEYEFVLLVVQYCTDLYVQTVHVVARSWYMFSVPAYARFQIKNFRARYRVTPP